MARSLVPLCILIALSATGCPPQEASTTLVPANPFGNAPVIKTPTQVSYSPATKEAGMRVALIGQKILATNPQLGMRPLFRTTGAPQAEIFHRDNAELWVTEGLVKQCVTEGQLAAVLCLELGKMVAEREDGAGLRARAPESDPPPDMPVGPGTNGAQGPADLTRLAELAQYEKTHPRPTARPAVLPDPQAVAKTLLGRAGYSAAEFEAGKALVPQATAMGPLEKQLSSPPARPWVQ